MNDFEREIELELHRTLDPLAQAPIPPRRTLPSRSTRLRAILGGAGAALSVKLLTSVAVAAAAVTVAGASTTGSLNPTVWGQQVKERVELCKSQLADGEHGIGQCVSAFASTHGKEVASAARHHGFGNGNGEGQNNPNAHGGNSNANDHARDKTNNGNHATGAENAQHGLEEANTHAPVTVPARP